MRAEPRGSRDDDHRVPDLVVAEYFRCRVRSLGGQHRLGGIEQRHRGHQGQLSSTEVLDGGRQRDDGQPPEHYVRRRRDVTAGFEMCGDGQHGGGGPEPGHAEHDIGERPGHGEQAVRRRGGSDENEDHLVVDLAHAPAGGGAHVNRRVVAGAHREQPDQCQGVQAHAVARAVAPDEHDGGGKGTTSAPRWSKPRSTRSFLGAGEPQAVPRRPRSRRAWRVHGPMLPPTP